MTRAGTSGSGRGRGATGVLAVLVAAGLVGGCWGGGGEALVDSSTTVAAATGGTRGTAGPATTAVVTTRPIPSTTRAVPVTTGALGPAGQPLTFRGMTIRLRGRWRAGGGGDHLTVATGAACRRSAGGVDCPGFLLLGPTQIAVADELGPFDPEAPWHPGAGVEGCPQDRDRLAEQTPTRPLRRGFAKVGPKRAVYREWRIPCVDARTGDPRTSYLQRVWHLPVSQILIVDEWSTPGLDRVLAEARFA